MIEIHYTLQVHSPLRVGTGIGKAAYLDNTIVRDAYGQPFIPGSTIKGKTRAAMFRLAGALGLTTHSVFDEPNGCLADGQPVCDICRIFGSPQIPGNLYFDNVVLHEDIQKVLEVLDDDLRSHHLAPKAALSFGQNIRTNVALDRRTRTSLADHLFSTESVGKPLIFRGSIRAEECAALTERDTACLVLVLQQITHLGGARGRGMGRCEIMLEEAFYNGDSILPRLNSIMESKEGK